MKRTRLMILAGAAGLSGLVFCVGPAFAQNASQNTVNSNNTTHTNTTTTTDSLNNNNINSKNNTAKSTVKDSGNSASLAVSHQHQSQGNNNGSQTIISTTPDKQTIYNVPNVYAPGLAAAGAEVCLGSVSAGGAGAGIGVSIGGTYVDQECQLRLNARTLATLGYTVAAREEMCIDSGVRAAMLAAGSPCAADMGAHAAPYNALSSQSSYVAPPVQEASAQGCERRYQLFGGWYEVCK
jgi:hypothetical protein